MTVLISAVAQPARQTAHFQAAIVTAQQDCRHAVTERVQRRDRRLRDSREGIIVKGNSAKGAYRLMKAAA